ncbi:MAG: hypothetical protein WC759_01065, partial [Candidatus Micrarchaeia archaeon]
MRSEETVCTVDINQGELSKIMEQVGNDCPEPCLLIDVDVRGMSEDNKPIVGDRVKPVIFLINGG